MTHPTIKALQKAVTYCEMNKKGTVQSVDGGYFAEHRDLIQAALRTLIDLHQDVEGDMPQEIWAVMHITVNDLEQIGMYTQSMPTNPEKAQRYHRADTHINELTKRIENA